MYTVPDFQVGTTKVCVAKFASLKNGIGQIAAAKIERAERDVYAMIFRT
jgi:hypothetical protein